MKSYLSFILLIVLVFNQCLCDDKKYALSDKQGGVPLEDAKSGRSEFLSDSNYYVVYFSGDKDNKYKLSYHYKIERNNGNDQTDVKISSFKPDDSFISFTPSDILYYNKEKGCSLKDLKYKIDNIDKGGLSLACDYIYKQLDRLAVNDNLSFYVNEDNKIVNSLYPDGASMELVSLDDANNQIKLYYNPSSHPIAKDEGITGSLSRDVEVFVADVFIYISDSRTYFQVNGKTGNTDLFNGLLRYDITRQNNNNETIIKLDKIVDKSSIFTFSSAATTLFRLLGCKLTANQEYRESELEQTCPKFKKYLNEYLSDEEKLQFYKIDESSKKVYEGSLATFNPATAKESPFNSDKLDTIVQQMKRIDKNYDDSKPTPEPSGSVVVVPIMAVVLMFVVFLL